jgi:rSAM/selenodomain-associated transferase 2
MSHDDAGEAVRTRVSIVIPVLNEAGAIALALAPLQSLRTRGHEVILADGGSTDGTRLLAQALCDHDIVAPRGRAAQMNAGAALASGEVILFLHADTRLPAEALQAVVEGLERSGRAWGRFDVRIAGRPRLLRVIAMLMNLRSRLTGIATGDQAIFVRADAFRELGGFDEIPLMEDIAFSRRAKRALGHPLCLRELVETSGRRWEKHGVSRTILLMWRLRLAYFCGVDPARLARRYGYVPRPEN